jgi:hypothetical protein
MKMENEEKNDSSQDRRSFFRKLVAVAAATGISGLLLGKLAEPVSASNIIPGSGKATFDGPVGIATTSPETLLHVSGGAKADVFCGLGPHPNNLVGGVFVGPAMNYGYSGHSFGEGSGFFNVRPDAAAVAPNPSLRFMTNNVQRIIITNAGLVGINTSSPAAQLDVETSGMVASQFVTTGGWNGVQSSGDGGAHFGGITTDGAGSYIWIGRATTGETLPDIKIGSALLPGLVGIGTTPLVDNQLYVSTSQTNGIRGITTSTNGNGIVGICNVGVSAYGVWGQSSTGFAGFFSGAVYVTGLLTKAGGGFKIDHPLDPANKILYHSFVESPDMKNLYDGVATLDANGEAVVQLPTYFGALNKDFRYQLTPIGGPMNLYIASKVDNNNQFKISGGTPNAEVSWTVTGTRQDPFANANRITPEVDKTPEQVNTYLHPELYGQPASQTMDKPPPEATTPSGPSTSRG